MKAHLRFPPGKRRSGQDGLPGIVATVRCDRRTKNLTRRLRPGEIAVIDHTDIDVAAADALIACQAAAVVNAARSISGRYPNLGPEMLLQAGIPLVDEAGPDLFDRVAEGDEVRLDGDTLYCAGHVVAKGCRQDRESVAAAMARARAGLAAEIQAFATNTMEYITREYPLLIDGIAAPPLRTRLSGRHVLVVVRGYHHREDLATLRSYIRETRPALIGVDGGADALLDAGYRPDIILGDMDSVSDRALACGAEVVVHAYPDGTARGLDRVKALGVPSVLCPAPGTSEDVALLLADEKGASLIVAVGRHDTLVEFLDKGRAGMASTFLTRLRLGGKIVEAKGVSRLYRSGMSLWAVVPLLLAFLVTLVVAIRVLPGGKPILNFIDIQLSNFWYWLTGLF
jgi:uncharacterized membrane-anchored protein